MSGSVDELELMEVIHRDPGAMEERVREWYLQLGRDGRGVRRGRGGGHHPDLLRPRRRASAGPVVAPLLGDLDVGDVRRRAGESHRLVEGDQRITTRHPHHDLVADVAPLAIDGRRHRRRRRRRGFAGSHLFVVKSQCRLTHLTHKRGAVHRV